MEPLDLLGIFAHPDDAELLAGGALIAAADRNERVGVVDLTAGEMGTAGTPELRAREAEAAARVMGLVDRRNAGLPDAGIANDATSRTVVARLLRTLRPRVVVTHWLEGRHPDHRRTAELVYDACFLAGLRRFQAEGEPHRPDTLVHATAFREDAPRPTYVVDVSAQMERKLEALACYASQFEGKNRAGEVFPAGDRPLLEQIRAHGAYWGSRIRTLYGEPFWTRETVRQASLTEPGPGSF